mgnify:CR=1 FL=1
MGSFHELEEAVRKIREKKPENEEEIIARGKFYSEKRFLEDLGAFEFVIAAGDILPETTVQIIDEFDADKPGNGPIASISLIMEDESRKQERSVVISGDQKHELAFVNLWITNTYDQGTEKEGTSSVRPYYRDAYNRIMLGSSFLFGLRQMMLIGNDLDSRLVDAFGIGLKPSSAKS